MEHCWWNPRKWTHINPDSYLHLQSTMIYILLDSLVCERVVLNNSVRCCLCRIINCRYPAESETPRHHWRSGLYFLTIRKSECSGAGWRTRLSDVILGIFRNISKRRGGVACLYKCGVTSWSMNQSLHNHIKFEDNYRITDIAVTPTPNLNHHNVV